MEAREQLEPVRAVTDPIVEPRVQSVSVGADGSVFVADQRGDILERTAQRTPWTRLKSNDIVASPSVNAPSSQLFGIASGVTVVSPVAEELAFAPLPQTGPTVVELAVANGGAGFYDVWARTASGELWVYSALSRSWNRVRAGVQHVAATLDGAVYVVVEGRVYARDGGPDPWIDLKAPTPVTGIAAGMNGAVWIVGGSGAVFRRGGDPLGWQPTATPPAQPAQIARGDEGTVWILAGGALYAYRGSAWHEVGWPGPRAPATIALASEELAFVIDAAGVIYQYTEYVDAWIPVAGDALPDFVTRVSAKDANHLWALDRAGAIYLLTRTGQGFQSKQVRGKMAAIATGADWTTWAVDLSGVPYYLFGDQFEPESAPAHFTAIAVGSSTKVIALDSSGRIYWHVAPNTWQSMSGEPPQGAPTFIDIAIDPHEVMRGIDLQHRMWIRSGGWARTGALDLTHVSSSCDAKHDYVWGISTHGIPVHVQRG
jgi:hypothetical protein